MINIKPGTAISIGIGSSVLLSLFSCSDKPKETKLPNIIYILADDMGYGDLSCLNTKSMINTQNMDRIAHEGIRFTDAHSPSAVSTPTRYGILTGQYCFRTRLKSGVLVGHSEALIDKERQTLAELLQEKDYETACIGKWHLGFDWPRKDSNKALFEGNAWDIPNTENVDYNGLIGGGPTDHGFDFSYVIPASLDIAPYVYISNKKLVAPIEDHIEGRNEPRGVFWRHGDRQKGFDLKTVLPTITEQAIKFIRGDHRKNKKQAFFLYFPLTAPHTPWLPSEEFKNQSGAGLYGDFVLMVDHCVGEILKVLDEENLTENTLIIVTSDNGAHWTPQDKQKHPHLANHIFSGMKSDVWEGGHHVPFIARWPKKIPPGSVCDQTTCLVDLFATCADITNTPYDQSQAEDSYSFYHHLLNPDMTQPIRPHTIHHSVSGKFSIRQGEWKLIDCKGSGGWSSKGNEKDPDGQLYNYTRDPEEKHNLYLENPKKAKELLEQIKISGK